VDEESPYPYANKRKCIYGPYSSDGPVHAATYKTQHNIGALMRVIITILFLITHSLPEGLQTTEPPQLQLKS
jgi:zinc transporter ZupT